MRLELFEKRFLFDISVRLEQDEDRNRMFPFESSVPHPVRAHTLHHTDDANVFMVISKDYV